MSSVRLSALYVMIVLDAGEPTRVIAGKLKPVIRTLLRDMRKRLKKYKLSPEDEHSIREAISILSNCPKVEDTPALCLMWNTVTEESDPPLKYHFLIPTKAGPEAGVSATFQRKDEARAAAFLRRKLPRIRKAAGPYANLCVRALADIRRGLDPDSTDLLALYLATRRILPSDSWALTVLLYHPRNPCR